MPLTFLQCEKLPLPEKEVTSLWQATITDCGQGDSQVNIQCVSETEMQLLNQKYRGKDAPTNVLTFSYPAGEEGKEHDIALCLAVAVREAESRKIELRAYVALLLVHAFLHAQGVDHEKSAQEEKEMQAAEQRILMRAGFESLTL